MNDDFDNMEVDVKLVDAAVDLCVFCRIGPYPKENTPEFMKLTELVDRLDTEVRKLRK